MALGVFTQTCLLSMFFENIYKKQCRRIVPYPNVFIINFDKLYHQF